MCVSRSHINIDIKKNEYVNGADIADIGASPLLQSQTWITETRKHLSKKGLLSACIFYK